MIDSRSWPSAAQRSVDAAGRAGPSRCVPRSSPSATRSLAGEAVGPLPAGIEVVAGPEGLAAAGPRGPRWSVNGVVGCAGLTVTLAALNAGRRLALANKESIIAGAPVVRQARQVPGAEIIPVDSEHCALHQCLAAVRGGCERGGGPACWSRRRAARSGDGRSDRAGHGAGWSEALAHPTWSMGPKIRWTPRRS